MVTFDPKLVLDGKKPKRKWKTEETWEVRKTSVV